MSATRDEAVRLDRLRRDARYRLERRDLYRAKTYGPRPTRPERLRELERDYERAAERLHVAEAGVEQAAATAEHPRTP